MLQSIKLPSLKEQFGTLEQYQKLKELGCPQGISNSVFLDGKLILDIDKSDSSDQRLAAMIDAYSVAELGEIIRQIVTATKDRFDDDDYKLPYPDYMCLPTGKVDEEGDWICEWDSFWTAFLGWRMDHYDGGSEVGENKPQFPNEAQARCAHLIYLLQNLSPENS